MAPRPRASYRNGGSGTHFNGSTVTGRPKAIFVPCARFLICFLFIPDEALPNCPLKQVKNVQCCTFFCRMKPLAKRENEENANETRSLWDLFFFRFATGEKCYSWTMNESPTPVENWRRQRVENLPRGDRHWLFSDTFVSKCDWSRSEAAFGFNEVPTWKKKTFFGRKRAPQYWSDENSRLRWPIKIKKRMQQGQDDYFAEVLKWAK